MSKEGFVHRMMPPVDWNCGSIPEICFNPSLSKRDIENILIPIYLDENRIKLLVNSDDPEELWIAKLQLELLAEIDAETIWVHNVYS